MADTMTIRASKKGRTSVPQPAQGAHFVLGSRPAVLRSPPLTRIKPGNPQARDYGKGGGDDTSGFGNTGMSGLS